MLSLPAIERLIDEALAGLSASRREPRRQQLLGLLQAFLEAARPAGGLPLGRNGQPLELARLRAEGARLATDGAGAERLWQKLRRAQPMDQRLAEAVMHFFRHVLGRPGLELEQLGAVAGERHAALKRIELAVKAARDDVPAEILGAFVTRASEAAQVSVALADYVRHYSRLRAVTDAHGVARLELRQTNRYRPVRLVPHAARHPLRLTAEWFQWNRTPAATLLLRRLDAALQPQATQEVPLRKTMRNGFVVIEADPERVPEFAEGLPLQDSQGQPQLWEVEWCLDLVFNAADRDMLVNYAPIVKPRVLVEPAALDLVEVSVGDSPGLCREGDGWLLDRTLLPREVLAIRLRSRSLGEAQALAASPSGELRLSP